jgi:hypothetical protein
MGASTWAWSAVLLGYRNAAADELERGDLVRGNVEGLNCARIER